MKINNLLFDSKYCDWSRYSTPFNDLINNEHNNLLIFIENDNREQVTCYLEKNKNSYEITIFTMKNNTVKTNKFL